MTVDPAGDIYLAGSTYSLSFPTTSNAFQPTVNQFTGTNFLSATDAFVAKIHPAGAGAGDLVYSSYLGGNLGDGDGGISIALDASGFVYIIGSTESTNFRPLRRSSTLADSYGPGDKKWPGYSRRLFREDGSESLRRGRHDLFDVHWRHRQ